jgi:SAM-dependent methyltransferase
MGDPFQDAALYDWEYRRRRDDVRFYRTLAGERGGPILDLGCGTGRLTIPLLRDGHVVVGLDRAAPMLARAATRVARLSAPARRRALLVRGDFLSLPLRPRPRFAFAVTAFHGVQHLHTDDDLVRYFRAVRGLLVPGGWFAFDLFAPDARFLARAPARRFDRTVFRHPSTGQRLAYTVSLRLDQLEAARPRTPDARPPPDRVNARRLTMTFHYQPLDGRGRPSGRERHARLAHRLLAPDQVARLLGRARLALIASWGGFDGRPLAEDNTAGEQNIYLVRRA